MINRLFNHLFLILALLFTCGASAQFYTGSHMEFGKNRVQYSGFYWQSYNFQRFKVYFYAGGKNHAIYAARSAHKSLKELEALFDFYMEDKIEFIVYNSQSDFKQSNIGITNDRQTNIGGVTQIVGSKVFIYYEGNHDDFDQQIRGALARVLVNQMMYGGNWKDVLKNSTLLTLPEWFTEGFISYASKDWSVEIDSRVKDGILSNRFVRFNRLEGKDAEYAGHAIWNFIAEKYGETVIPNIFYMARVSRNVESGFLFVLGLPLRTLTMEYLDYYKRRYMADQRFQSKVDAEEIPIKRKDSRIYYQYKIDPTGKYATYVSNELGQYKLWIHDLDKTAAKEKKRYAKYLQKKAKWDQKQEAKASSKEGYTPRPYKPYKPGKYRSKRILKKEHKLNRIVDLSFPVTQWHPTIPALAYVTERRGNLFLVLYSLEEKKKTRVPLRKLDKVLDFHYSDDGKKIIMSGVANGQTDLYLYQIVGNTQTQLTNDIYDDLNPRFIDGSNRVIFSSDRTSDTLPRMHKPPEVKPYDSDYDIYVYDLENDRPIKVLDQITNTPLANEFQPSAYDTARFTYLSDENGIFNRYIAEFDSSISHIDTVIHYDYFSKTYPVSNSDRNILEYDIDPKTGIYSALVFRKGQYHFLQGNRRDDEIYLSSDLKPTQYIRHRNSDLAMSNGRSETSSEVGKVESIVDTTRDDSSIDIENYQFDDEEPKFEKEVIRLDEGQSTVVDTSKTTAQKKKEKEEEFKRPTQFPYRLNFAVDYVVSQIDNNFLNQSYQRYTGPGSVYFNPRFNGLMKIGLSDVFDDYKILGGFRLAGDLNSGEYLLSFEDLSGRIDHRYQFFRNSFLSVTNVATKFLTHEAKYRAKYAIDEVMSVRLTGSYRNDRNITLATDALTLDEQTQQYNMAGLKTSFVFDNTRPKGLNLYNGTRFKVFGEAYREIDNDQAWFFVVGGDFRHYQKVHRDIIWASRLALSTSFGDKKLVYYMGGVDNWVLRPNPNFDMTTEVATDQNYAFQTIATPMRGFIQNIRNGNSFALFNTELRWPIVKYFSYQPLKSDFLENFQLIGFYDAGAAWTGPHPYSRENSFNTEVIEQKPVVITIENQREPIVQGFGFGLRSRLFGYFIRFDWAWGVEDGTIQESVRYLSLTLDF